MPSTSPRMRLERAVSLNVFCLGMSALVFQMVALREFLSIFTGNELVLGLVLGNWLLLTGLGGLTARWVGKGRVLERHILGAQLAVALLPLLETGLLRGLALWRTPGLMFGLGEAFLTSFLVLAPFCLVSGFLLALYSGGFPGRISVRSRDCAVGRESGQSIGRESGQSISRESGQSISLESGQSIGRESGQSISLESGQSISLESGQSISLESGQSISLESGQSIGRESGQSIGQVYVLDSLGGIVGGLLFSLVLVHLLSHFLILGGMMAVDLMAAAYLAHVQGRRQARGAMLLLGAFLLVAVGMGNPDLRSARWLFPGLELQSYQSTPYGQLAETRDAGQVTFFENGIPVGSSNDPQYAEESVHFAMAQLERPARVLMVSGGLAGTLLELNKYPLEQIDYVEPDEKVADIVRRRYEAQGTDVERSQVKARQAETHFIVADARPFIRRSAARYDAILLALPEPVNAALNRYYTEEFFLEARAALRGGGVLSFSISGAENYASEEARAMAASIFSALTAVFRVVLVIPGERMVFLASSVPMSSEVGARLELKGIRTRFIREAYLRARLTEDRLESLRNIVTTPADPNRDLYPVTYLAHLHYWLRQVGGGLFLIVLLVGLLVAALFALIYASPRRSVSLALCTSGVSGIGLEIVILITFQIYFGYVYEQVGVILSAFLIGAAVGAWLVGRSRRRFSSLFKWSDSALAGAAFLLAPSLSFLHGSSWLESTIFGPFLFASLNGVIGLLVGAQFPAGAGLLAGAWGNGVLMSARSAGGERWPHRQACTSVSGGGAEGAVALVDTAGRLYALDLLGACLGAIVVSALCVPAIGVAATCFVLGGLKLLSAFSLLLAGKLEIGREWALVRASDSTLPGCLPGAPADQTPGGELAARGPGLSLAARGLGLGTRAAGLDLATRAPGKAFAFALLFLIFLGIGLAIVSEETRATVYALSFATPYPWLMLAMMGLGLVSALGVKGLSGGGTTARAQAAARALFDSTRVRLFQWLSYLVFALAIFYPIFRCYFKVPYLFCHTCPRKCIFGFMRSYLVPGALLMNLEKRFWCYRACPLGTLQDGCARISGRARRAPKIFRRISLAVLAFVVVGYFAVKWDLEQTASSHDGWYIFFFNNTFGGSVVVVGVAVFLLLLSFIYRRPFCEGMCPVGRVSEILRESWGRR